jgi:hypothetical protein
MMYVAIGFAVGFPVFTPLLLAWAWIAPRYPRIESPFAIVGASIGLGVSAGTIVAVSYARMEAPFGAHGGQLAAISGVVGLVIALGLITPRFVIAALRPGRMLQTREPVI